MSKDYDQGYNHGFYRGFEQGQDHVMDQEHEDALHLSREELLRRFDAGSPASAADAYEQGWDEGYDEAHWYYTAPTGAEKYLAGRMKDPEYAAAYHEARDNDKTTAKLLMGVWLVLMVVALVAL